MKTGVQLEQVIEVDGNEVPLHCNGLRLYYREGELTAIDANIVPPDEIEVAGTVAIDNGEVLRKLVSEKLGLPVSRVSATMRQCVHFEKKDPRKGKLVTQVEIGVGKGRKPIEVLLDNETKAVFSEMAELI